jgi:phosphoribosylglycinamide formyltransferase-1
MAMRLAFFASGNGTTMRNIVAAIRERHIAAEPALLIASKPDCGAMRFAKAEGIPARTISRTTHPDAGARDAAILSALKEAAAEVIILSGYLHKIGPQVLKAFAPRIINIHPALLPRFGGKGMYGHHVHEAVLAAGETQSGATVHIVDAEYDHGPIIAQRRVPVLAGDTADSLGARVEEAAEKDLMIETVRAIAEGEIDLAMLARSP